MEVKKLTQQQKKAGWIIAIILILVHFAPGIINRVRQNFVHSSAPALSKPDPRHFAPAPAPIVTAPKSQVQYARFVGIWTGGQLMPDQYTCQITLEVRPNTDDPDKVSGFETRSCVPSAIFARGPKQNVAEIIRQASPLSAMMTGSVTAGDLTFRVDKTVGTSPDHCPLTSYEVSPFGEGQVMAQWQEGSCQSGQMLLKKTRG